MSKLIRNTCVKSRPGDTRRCKSPIWVLSGGEVDILNCTKGAVTWTLATERDFGAKPTVAVNDEFFINL